MKRIPVLILFFSVVVGLAALYATQPKQEPASSNTNSSNDAMDESATPPPMNIDTAKKYQATLKTEKGDIVIDLKAAETPITVNNFVSLSESGFYDNTIFHRTIKGFMIQGGDPNGNGTGGPGYRFDDEPFEGKYTRGTIAMANAGPNTNGSQFFIMHKDYDLPPNYVIFGHVASGLDVVDAIAEAPTAANQMGENSTPVDPVHIQTVEIIQQ